MVPLFIVPPICSETGGDLARNHVLGALELAEIHIDPPERLFCYPAELPDGGNVATTWMGGRIGTLVVGRKWRSNLGDERQSVRIIAPNGVRYSGIMFGTYIRAARVS